MTKTVKNMSVFFLVFMFFFISLDGRNRVIYKKKTETPVLDEISKERDRKATEAGKITQVIVEKNLALKKSEEENEREMSTDLTGVFPPSSIEAFNAVFHFEPVAQYYTSTCWSFSATSFYESEIFRLHKQKIKLSEMWTVYHELLAKAERFINERGHSFVSGGGETNGVNRIWKTYGVVPAAVYTGLPEGDQRHDHVPMMKEISGYLDYVKENGLWNVNENLAHVRLILNKHMGEPPAVFMFEGKNYDPLTFFKEVVRLDMDDYCSVMSTKFFPFYTKQEFTVPDNWWRSRDYINLPLDVWYGIIKKSIGKGYSIVIGGDVSEPGKVGPSDISFIPSFDIPEKFIDQDSREYRIYNKTTDDDHGIHLVGYTKKAGKDWYLIKDSGRSARQGKHEGYYFFREDFIRLKMLTFTVHKDMLKDILPKIR